MTAQFAGSRSLDDRRRRRLAQESDSDPISSGKKSKKRSNAATAPEIGPEEMVRTDVVAEESIIPRALWKVCFFGGASISTWLLLMWVNFQLPLSSEFHQVFSASEGKAFGLLNTFNLLVTSQLCFIIWWYRSRSRKDFGGRYRIWAWAGCFWSGVCLISGLKLHRPLANFAYQTWPIHTWKPELLYWFVPFSIGVLTLHQLISLDMRHSRASRILWNSAFFCSLISAAILFAGDLALPESERAILHAGISSLWHLMNSFALLYHARFVVHVTNEAAPQQEMWYSRLKVKMFQLFSRTYHLFAGLLAKLQFRSEEQREAAATKKLQRRELKASRKEEKKQKLEAAKAEKAAARELALEEKKAAQQAKVQAKIDATHARKEQKLAEEEKRKAAREEKKKANLEKKPQEKVAEKPSPVSQNSSEDKTPRTKSGRKRKRVLGNKQRVDPPEAVNPPHEVESSNESKSAKKAARSKELEEMQDDYDESDQEFRNMSKKQKRRARKKQRR